MMFCTINMTLTLMTLPKAHRVEITFSAFLILCGNSIFGYGKHIVECDGGNIPYVPGSEAPVFVQIRVFGAPEKLGLLEVQSPQSHTTIYNSIYIFTHLTFNITLLIIMSSTIIAHWLIVSLSLFLILLRHIDYYLLLYIYILAANPTLPQMFALIVAF